MKIQNRKIIITVAPVCHVEKPVPESAFNPVSPEDIARDVTDCANAGASMVHLHTREENGELVEKHAALVREMGLEPANPSEAREILGINKLRK